jgi:hypothetical protein
MAVRQGTIAGSYAQPAHLADQALAPPQTRSPSLQDLIFALQALKLQRLAL